MISPEMQMKVTRWRAAAVAGTLSAEDCIDAIIFLRAERKAGVISAAKSRSKATTPAIDTESMLGELGL